MKGNWLRRRWMEGRAGHSVYLMFSLTMINFILISYRFLIEKDSFFMEMISDLWVFGLILLACYIPASLVIGFWHRKTQYKVERSIKDLENPLLMKMFRVWLDTETEKATKKEIEEFRKFLITIEKRN